MTVEADGIEVVVRYNDGQHRFNFHLDTDDEGYRVLIPFHVDKYTDFAALRQAAKYCLAQIEV